MAVNHMQKLEEQLSCSVCLNQYKDPKILPCHHSFCRECLRQTPLELEEGRHLLKCPTCRVPTQLSDGGVPALPPSFFINNLLDLYQGVQQIDSNTADSSNTWPCPDHGKPLDLYCNNCDEVVCSFCTTHKHRGHVNDRSTEAYDRCMSHVHKLLAIVDSKAEKVDMVSQALDYAMTKIKDQGNEANQQVNEAADEMILKINQSRQELLKQAEQATERKYKVLQLQKEKSISMREKLQSAGNSVRQVLQEKSKQKIMASKNEIIQRLKSANSNIDMKAMKPAEKADLCFKQKEDTDLGEIQSSLWCEKFIITSKGPFYGLCGKESRFDFEIQQLDDENVTPPAVYLTCTTVPKTEITLTSKENKCSISYVPTACGKLRLTFLIGGIKVQGGSFTVTVLPSFKHSNVIEGFSKPLGIAVSEGNIAVAEGGSQKIALLTSNGGRRSFDCPRPHGVVFTNDQHILAADNSEGCIKKFTFQGTVKKKYSPSGGMYSEMVRLLAKASVFDNLLGIAISESGKVAFVENRSETLQLLNSDLSYYGCFEGGFLSSFGHPTDVAFDSSDNIYVSSDGDNVVVKFNLEYTKFTKVGKPGCQDGQLQCPSAITIGENDVLYVAEKDNHRISVFDSDGRFLTCFGQKGNGKGELNGPCGIAVDESGKLYVSDTGNNRVVVYE